MTAYRHAAEVAKIGADLVANEPDHAHLRGIRIEYLFRDKPATHGGRIVLGRARRVGGLAAILAGSSAVTASGPQRRRTPAPRSPSSSRSQSTTSSPAPPASSATTTPTAEVSDD